MTTKAKGRRANAGPQVNRPTHHTTATHDGQGRRQRVPVLVVGHGDSWCEVYAPRGAINLHFATLANVQGAEAEILAERLLGLRLPPHFRRLYEPGNRIGADVLKCLTPNELRDVAQWQRACRFFSAPEQTELLQWTA